MKDIQGYESQYAITESGLVWSHKTKRFLKAQKTADGYLRIGLRDTKNSQARSLFLVHRLVADAFIENTLQKPQINHKNSVRDDNRVENLEWSTLSENMFHAWSFGNKKFVHTERHRQAVKRNILVAQAANIARTGTANGRGPLYAG